MFGQRLPVLICIAAAAVGLTWLSPFVWLVLLTDGLPVLAIVAAAAGWGAWPVRWLGFGRDEAGRQFCLATALGLGLLSTTALALGVGGVLSRPAAWGVLAAGWMSGVACLRQCQKRCANDEPSGAERSQEADARRFSVRLIVPTVLLLLLVVPLVVMLFGACLPPGLLWPGEANGYDVLEYHLQGPREYYQAGRIMFLPHNVYTSFPQQMELLYLLLMHLTGGTHAAAIPAQLLHAACGILAVAALAAWTRAGIARYVTAALAGTVPWLAYLGVLAYVENGMLFFTAIAGGIVVSQIRETKHPNWKIAFAVGGCAGLAGGCKYTALVLVALALGLAWLVVMRDRSTGWKPVLRNLVVFGFGTLLAFSPWLIKNAAFTGNPVYPFAYQWLGGAAWSAEQDRQWSDGHRVPPEHDSITGRLALAGKELFGSLEDIDEIQIRHHVLTRSRFSPSLFGQVIFVLALLGLLIRRDRAAIFLAVWAGLAVLAWMTLTFIPGRFVVPLVVPLAMLGGEAITDLKVPGNKVARRWTDWLLIPIVIVGALLNDAALAGRLRDRASQWAARTGVPMKLLLGQAGVFVENHYLNRQLSTDAQVWLVGDAAVFYADREIHYSVTFSRDPWLEFAATATPAESVNWLRQRGVSHVAFAWSEIERFRRTYGFSDVVTPEWVADLEKVGLQRVESDLEEAEVSHMAIYEIPPADE